MHSWSTACPDWEKRIVAGESLISSPPLFDNEAAAAVAVFKSLKIVNRPKIQDEKSGEWRYPTFGDLSADWVFDFVGVIFGALDVAAKKRLISEFLLLISKKNGKSTIVAGIMVTAIIRNRVSNEELLILAPTLEIAKNAWKPAAGMIRADEELTALLHISDHNRTIKHLTTEAELKVVAADTDTVGGKMAGFVLVDELWMFGKRPNADGMLQEATGGLATKPYGFVIYVSTHSDEPPAGVFDDTLKYFRDVRDGKVVDNACLPVMYEFPPSMLASKAYLDSDNWYITNPHLGRSVQPDYIMRKYNQALQGDRGALQKFLAKYLNVEISMRNAGDRWSGADLWESCADESLTLKGLLSRVEVAVVGGDGGGKDDWFGLTVAGREKETGRWLFWSHAFALKSALLVRKKIASKMRGFASDGDLTLCNKLSDILAGVASICQQVLNSGLMPEEDAVGLDPAQLGALVDTFAGMGLAHPRLVGLNTQAWGMCSAIFAVEFKLADLEMRHDGSRMMNFCVGNAKTVPVKNTVLITKQASGACKIDPLISLLLAAKLLERNPEAKPKVVSVYEELGRRRAAERANA